MTENELIEEAKNRYPNGCIVKSIDPNYKLEMKIFDNSRFTTYRKEEGCWVRGDKHNGHNYNPCLYYQGQWAEIVSYPEGYIPKSTSLLQKIEIW